MPGGTFFCCGTAKLLPQSCTLPTFRAMGAFRKPKNIITLPFCEYNKNSAPDFSQTLFILFMPYEDFPVHILEKHAPSAHVPPRLDGCRPYINTDDSRHSPEKMHAGPPGGIQVAAPVPPPVCCMRHESGRSAAHPPAKQECSISLRYHGRSIRSSVRRRWAARS